MVTPFFVDTGASAIGSPVAASISATTPVGFAGPLGDGVTVAVNVTGAPNVEVLGDAVSPTLVLSGSICSQS